MSATHQGRCPLCNKTGDGTIFYSGVRRQYLRCACCQLISVSPSTYLPWQAERAEYDKHRNLPDDLGYRRFLDRLYSPLLQRIDVSAHGLDFGSGPGPVLSMMLQEAGCEMNIYDPYYSPDRDVLQGCKRYDFITATEVLEHLQDPAGELELLWNLLKPEGWLGLMTKLAHDRAAFSRWHYKNDPTHICFFSTATMQWLARKWNTELVQIGADVFFFQKPAEG